MNTIKVRILAVSLVVSGIFCLNVTAEDKSQAAQYQVEPVVASVGDKAITKNDLFNAILEFFPTQANDTLNRLINAIVINKEADKRKITISENELKAKAQELGITKELTSSTKDLIKTSLLTEKMLKSDKKITVTKEEVETLFNNNKAELGVPDQVHIRQIFVKSEPEAKDILIALNAGADFAKMAEAKSQDASSKDKGGDLGFFGKGTLMPEIEKVAFSLKTGAISPIITSTQGFHILKLEERKEPKQATLDKDMRKKLENYIINDKIQKAFPEWVADLRKTADIK
jgi:foldase protein PrsA